MCHQALPACIPTDRALFQQRREPRPPREKPKVTRKVLGCEHLPDSSSGNQLGDTWPPAPGVSLAGQHPTQSPQGCRQHEERRESWGLQSPQASALTIPPQPQHGQWAPGQQPHSLPGMRLQRQEPASESRYVNSPDDIDMPRGLALGRRQHSLSLHRNQCGLQRSAAENPQPSVASARLRGISPACLQGGCPTWLVAPKAQTCLRADVTVTVVVQYTQATEGKKWGRGQRDPSSLL